MTTDPPSTAYKPGTLLVRFEPGLAAVNFRLGANASSHALVATHLAFVVMLYTVCRCGLLTLRRKEQ